MYTPVYILILKIFKIVTAAAGILISHLLMHLT